MDDVTQQTVGKTVQSVERFKNSYDEWSGFVMIFTDGTKLEVSSRWYPDGSQVEVDIR